MALLNDIANHPESPVTERYARLDLRPESGKRILDNLVARGMLKPISVKLGTSRVRLFDPTGASWEALGRTQSDRHGGAAHRFWISRLATQLTDAGYSVMQEAPVGAGKAVDLLVRCGTRQVAVEVETGKSDWIANVRKSVGAFDRVLVAIIDERRRPHFEREARESGVSAEIVFVGDIAEVLASDGPCREKMRGRAVKEAHAGDAGPREIG